MNCDMLHLVYQTAKVNILWYNTFFYPLWHGTDFDYPIGLVYHTVISVSFACGTGSTWPILKSLRTILYFIVSHIFIYVFCTLLREQWSNVCLTDFRLCNDKSWYEAILRTSYVLVTCCSKYVKDKEISFSWTCSNK